MSGTASASAVVGGGSSGGEIGHVSSIGGGYHASFTPMQWQELNHQAMIYKYLVAGLQVPPDLVVPIRRSFEALSSRLFAHPSLGYCSYYGKKFDPEPGRCRRTDGKKWRCSKEAHPDSKYCERHMHRGRNRSRKPVESQSATTRVSNSNSNSNNGNNAGSFQVTGSGSFQNVPLYSVPGPEGLSNSMMKMQMEPLSYEMGGGFSPEASGSLGSGGTWHLVPSQGSDPQLLNLSSARENSIAMISEQRRQQHHHHHLVHPFFSEWPMAKASSWSSLDDDGGDRDPSNGNLFSSTQLSISTPRTSSGFSSRSGYSPNE